MDGVGNCVRVVAFPKEQIVHWADLSGFSEVSISGCEAVCALFCIAQQCMTPIGNWFCG